MMLTPMDYAVIGAGLGLGSMPMVMMAAKPELRAQRPQAWTAAIIIDVLATTAVMGYVVWRRSAEAASPPPAAPPAQSQPR